MKTNHTSTQPDRLTCGITVKKAKNGSKKPEKPWQNICQLSKEIWVNAQKRGFWPGFFCKSSVLASIYCCDFLEVQLSIFTSSIQWNPVSARLTIVNCISQCFIKKNRFSLIFSIQGTLAAQMSLVWMWSTCTYRKKGDGWDFLVIFEKKLRENSPFGCLEKNVFWRSKFLICSPLTNFAFSKT